MTLQDLVERAYQSSSSHATRKDIREILTDTFERIAQMSLGSSLRITHFGTFKKIVQKERRIFVNSAPPGVSEENFSRSLHVIPAFEVLKFRAAKGFGKRRLPK